MKIELITDEKVLDECALLMSQSEPFTTLRFSFEKCKSGMTGDYREVYAALMNNEFAGFVVLSYYGVLRGYIQTICLKSEFRNRGIGTALLKFSEERILKEFPNVFMCVSSFNQQAQKLYYSLGFEKIGELKNHIIEGADEYILRKQKCPITNFNPTK